MEDWYLRQMEKLRANSSKALATYFKSKKEDNKLIKLIEIFKKKEVPVMPFKASTLMEKYQVPEGRELGQKLKAIEEVWTSNDFKISDKEVQKIVSN